MVNLSGKSAIVTGGMNGIGYAICVELLNCGLNKIAIVDLQFNSNVFEELKSKFQAREIVYYKLDVSDKIQIENTYTEIKKVFGQINFLVNSAGMFDDKNVQMTMDVNAVGVINSSLIAVELMNPQNGGEGGTIINVASIVGLMAFPFSLVYASSKYAVIGFTRSLGNDFFYKHCGVRCMAVCPGVTYTEMLNPSTNKFVYPFVKEKLDAVLSSIIIQRPESVGKCVIKMLDSNKNGSIWISNKNENYEIERQELSIDILK